MTSRISLALWALLAAAAPSFAKDGKPKAKTPPPAEPAAEAPSFAPSTAAITTALIFDRLETLDKKLSSLSAKFKQTIRMEESGSVQRLDGEVDYLKPDRLRIEHLNPEKQTLISDGKSVWVHRKETNQVLQTTLSDWKRAEPLVQSLMDFGAYSSLLRRYDVDIASVGAKDPEGHRSLTLLLKPLEPQADFTLTLILSTRDFFPRQTALRAGQVEVATEFVGVRFNPPLERDRFDFKVPPGADFFPNFKPPAIR